MITMNETEREAIDEQIAIFCGWTKLPGNRGWLEPGRIDAWFSHRGAPLPPSYTTSLDALRKDVWPKIHQLLADASDAHMEKMVNDHYLCKISDLVEKSEDPSVKPLDQAGSTHYDVAITHASPEIIAAACISFIDALEKEE